MVRTAADQSLRRQLGLAAVIAVVVGDMLGSGIFFTPGEVASVAQANWQVYSLWALCGFITLCGALTLAELSTRFSRSGASYHIIAAGFGPFWAFLKIWVEMWVSGPGSVAGLAILFGGFVAGLFGGSPQIWGIAAILLFTFLNLLGIRWGGRTQVLLTTLKLLAVLALISGAIFFAKHTNLPVAEPPFSTSGFLRLLGVGVVAVLYTYDGWVDVTHAAGEVANPRRNLPLGLSLGVAVIVLLYLMVNYAFLRIVPLPEMRVQPAMIASQVAAAAFGKSGGAYLNAILMISMLGALGGLVMTLPRLYFAVAAEYQKVTPNAFFAGLSFVSKSAVPAGSILFCAVTSIAVIFAFGTFSRVATFFVVSLQFINILMVASVYHVRSDPGSYRTPGYPVTPAIFISVMALLVLNAIYYNPKDTLIGTALTALSFPVYLWLNKGKRA